VVFSDTSVYLSEIHNSWFKCAHLFPMCMFAYLALTSLTVPFGSDLDYYLFFDVFSNYSSDSPPEIAVPSPDKGTDLR
jgi:hypothetical protein